MPGLPFSPPVTLDELYRNIVHDMGWTTESVVASTPVTLRDCLLAMNNGAYNTNLGMFGSGVDGALQFNTAANGAGTVTLWNGTVLTASSNTYTLSQDLWLGETWTSSTTPSYPVIQSGVTINANGFRIFCQGTLQNNGTIESNGAAASANTAGAALSYTSTISNTTVGGAGGAGNITGNTAGSAVTNALGGVGGTGGNGNAHNGAAGGTVTAPTAVTSLPFALPLAAMVRTMGTTALSLLVGGSGGGSGGGDGTNNSGAGGTGGGIVLVCAQRLAGTGSIQANGGAGGTVSTGNSGGGGGGGGGLVIVIARNVNPLGGLNNQVSSPATFVTNQTITAAGGAGGTGAGSGNTGAVGAAGTTILIPA